MRFWADQISAFGPGILPRPLVYAEHVGLHLNIDRVRLQRASEVMTGIGFALSHGALPEAFFDAVALTAEDAQELRFATNMARSIAATKAKHGFTDQ